MCARRWAHRLLPGVWWQEATGEPYLGLWVNHLSHSQKDQGTGVGAAQGLCLWPCSQGFAAPPAGQTPNCT